MTRICHEHCPKPGSGTWLLIIAAAVAAIVVWAVGKVLTAAGKPVMILILTTLLLAIVSVIVAGIRGALRSSRNVATTIRIAAVRPTLPAKPAEIPLAAPITPTRPGRPRLRIVRDDERAA